MSANRRDRIPVEPVQRRVQEWAAINKDKGSPAELLAARAGMERSAFHKLLEGRYTSTHMTFDVVDRIFCALGQPTLIWRQPDLREHYERCAKEADRIAANVRPKPSTQTMERNKIRNRERRARLKAELATEAA